MPDQIPLASILSTDPFQAAAARQREAVRPTFGRQQGAASALMGGAGPPQMPGIPDQHVPLSALLAILGRH